MRKSIRGAVFPVPHQFVDRLFLNEKDVFVKWGRFRFLDGGQRLVFYDSGMRKLIGEARIQEVAYDDPMKIWKMYGNRIFLEKNEFEAYVTTSPFGYPRKPERSKLTAITFKKAHRYPTPKESPKRMTIAGYYLRD